MKFKYLVATISFLAIFTFVSCSDAKAKKTVDTKSNSEDIKSNSKDEGSTTTNTPETSMESKEDIENTKPTTPVEKEDNYSKLLSTLAPAISNSTNNTTFNYSLLFADTKETDYLFLSNNPQEVKDSKYKSASVIKIFVMIEAYNQINKGILSEATTLTLTQSMKVGGAGILSSYENGTTYTVAELIKLMITVSDNTATNMLIDILGMNNINLRIKELGCTNTELNRKMMDLDAINQGIENYTSVYDLYLTLMKLYKKECITPEYDSKMLEIMKQNTANSKIPSQLPQSVTVAHKTGELSGVENDAGIIFTPSGDYLLCILTANGSSTEEITTISNISKSIYDSFIEYKNGQN